MHINTFFIFWSLWFLVWIFFWNILFDFYYIIYFLIFITFLAFIIFFLLKKYHLIMIFFVSFIFIWIIYSWINNYSINKNHNLLQNFYNQKETKIIATVKEKYKNKDWNTSYIMILNKLNWEKIENINLLLTIPANYRLKPKEQVEFYSKISPIKSWSYKNYMLTKDIYLTIKAISINTIKKEELSYFEKQIYDLKQNFVNHINSILPPKEAWLLSWILIWEKNEMEPEILQNFNNAWLTHLIAVSWFNITLIIIFILFILKWVPNIIKAIIITIFIIFFTILVWAEAPVVRASIIWIIWYYILISWRNSHSISLLLFAWIIMVLYNPLFLNYDISFHLSFLAVFWLLYLQNFWDKIFFFLPKVLAIKESFVLTMSAMTTTLPILLINFWYIWLLSPIANMLVWWLIPFTMFIWFINVIINIFSETLWYYIWFITYFLLKYIIFIWNSLWSIDFFILKIDFEQYWSYLSILYLMFLFFITIFIKTKND